MNILVLQIDSLIFLGYVFAFGLAALTCFYGVTRLSRISNPDTRRGLKALLLTSGAWATAHVGFLVFPTPEVKLGFYHLGLLFGISTVGSWLYFCSAYTGRTLHRSRKIRRTAVVIFLLILAVKFTNPLHQLYFTSEFVTTPFPHLTIHNQLLHWIIMGVAYTLAAIGYFMLLELFWQVGHDTTPFLTLLGLTGLPLIFDIIGILSPALLDITYEPLGVAAFAIGVLFIYTEDFQTIQLAGEHDEPAIVIDDENRVRDYNTEAKDMFPSLEIGEIIDAVIPEITNHLDTDEAIIQINRAGGLRYYQIVTHPFSTNQTKLGKAITLTDVTEQEQYRTELERQNDRLEKFTSMVSHDLRNPLNVAKGRVEIAIETGDTDQLEAADNALDRMALLIEDLLTLARQGQPIAETEEINLASHAEEAWKYVATSMATLETETALTVMADPERLQQLFENLFRNAIEHGSEEATIRIGELDGESGFYVADDGPGIPEAKRTKVFESGYSSAADGTGFGLAIVKEIVEAHGWTISVTESWAGGARFEIRVKT